MLRALPLIALLFALTLAPASDTRAQSLSVDLSKHDVSITTSFTGSSLLLFGTTGSVGDVIVVVRGPREQQVVRRKERVAGVWVNKDAVTFDNIPSFYEIISNRNIDEILSDSELEANRIGLDHVSIGIADSDLDAETINEFRDALFRRKAAKGLYSDRETGVFFVSPTLFRTDVTFPVNIQVGSYEVDTYLVQEGRIVSMETTSIPVKKVGFEAEVYNFAHRNSLLYGILAVVIAVAAGWMANTIFRKA